MADNDPFSGSQVKRPLRVRTLRAASVILALAGLFLLYLYSVHRDIPLVRIDSVVPTMNFSTVRVAGEVTRDAFLFDSGGFVFTVDDGSGEIAVMGSRAQAEALDSAGRLPGRGDRVELVGSLSVGADRELKLRMQSVGQFVLQRKRTPAVSPASAPVPLSEITGQRRGECLLVSGILADIRVPAPGSRAPYVLTLEQDGAQLEVVFWDQVFQAMDRRLPVPGKRVRAFGRVDLYKGKVQLKIREAADFSEADG